ncbi:extracellular solute-binding protein [Streptomyces sp. NPDC051642]|uniref:ABC transporter substrate-binding protein n=1 Tax=unclassified Streptomyces TaxID=2593676 RepID=UPI0034239F7E
MLHPSSLSAAVSRRTVLKGVGSLTGAGLLAATGALTGCTSGAGTDTPAKVQAAKPGTLTIMTPAGDLSKETISAFHRAHPDVKIRQIETDPTRLNAMLAAGNPPDLVRDAGIDVTPYIASQGLALNLDEYMAQSSVLKEPDILPVNDVWKWDGTTQGKGARYGIAKDWSQDQMWWFNSDLWRAAGLTAPDPKTPVTYDQLLDHAKQLTKSSGGRTSVYGLWNVTPDIDRIAGMVATAGGQIISEDLGTVDFTSPEAQRALSWIVDAAKAGVCYSVTNPSPDWDGPEVLAGKQVAACQGYWFTGYVEATKPAYSSKLVLNSAPLLGSTRISPTYGAVGFWIPARAANPGASFAFMEWFCGGAGARTRISAGQGLPTLKSMLSLIPQRNAFEKASYATQQNELQYVKVIKMASPYALNTAINATLAKDFPRAITGGLSVAGLADLLTMDVNATLAAGKKALGK